MTWYSKRNSLAQLKRNRSLVQQEHNYNLAQQKRNDLAQPERNRTDLLEAMARRVVVCEGEDLLVRRVRVAEAVRRDVVVLIKRLQGLTQDCDHLLVRVVHLVTCGYNQNTMLGTTGTQWDTQDCDHLLGIVHLVTNRDNPLFLHLESCAGCSPSPLTLSLVQAVLVEALSPLPLVAGGEVDPYDEVAVLQPGFPAGGAQFVQRVEVLRERLEARLLWRLKSNRTVFCDKMQGEETCVCVCVQQEGRTHIVLQRERTTKGHVCVCVYMCVAERERTKGKERKCSEATASNRDRSGGLESQISKETVVVCFLRGLCVCVKQIDRQRDRERDRQTETDRQTHTHTDRWTERHTNRQIDRQTDTHRQTETLPRVQARPTGC